MFQVFGAVFCGGQCQMLLRSQGLRRQSAIFYQHFLPVSRQWQWVVFHRNILIWIHDWGRSKYCIYQNVWCIQYWHQGHRWFPCLHFLELWRGDAIVYLNEHVWEQSVPLLAHNTFDSTTRTFDIVELSGVWYTPDSRYCHTNNKQYTCCMCIFA